MKSFLYSIIKDRSSRMRILSAYRQFKRVEKEKRDIISLIDEMLTKEDKLSRLDVQREMLKKIKNVRDDFWKNLLSFHLALFSKNVFWYKELARKILLKGQYVHLMSGLNTEDFNNQLIINFVIKTLMFYESKNSKNDFKYLAKRMATFGEDRLEYREIEKRFSASWSLNEIRGSFNNPRLQFFYYDFFLELMLERTTELEVKTKIVEIIKDDIIRASSVNQLWFLNYHYPVSDSVREIITKKMGRAWVYGTFNERQQVIELIDHSVFKQSMKKRYKEFDRPNFKIKRDFYQSLLFSGKASAYAFYRLYELGDRAPEYLWWLIF